MKMKKILRNFLAVGVAVSFVLNSTAVVMATDGAETMESGSMTEIESEFEEETAAEETESVTEETAEGAEMDVPYAQDTTSEEAYDTEPANGTETVQEVAYIQFEGVSLPAEAPLGTAVELMSKYHGEVPEGKVFAGWTIGGVEYAPGAAFTFSKENGVDMGMNGNI